jgi:hypothetical protein
VLERGEGLPTVAVDEINVIILLQKDGRVLRQLQQMEEGQSRLVDVSQSLFAG